MKTTERRETGELDKLIHGDLARLADRAIASGRISQPGATMAQVETDECPPETPECPPEETPECETNAPPCDPDPTPECPPETPEC